MRRLILSWTALAVLVMSASAATAFEMVLVPITPLFGDINDTFTFEVYIDTQGASDMYAFSVGLEFDESILAYDPSQSNSTITEPGPQYYPFYTAGMPPRGINPTFDPPQIFGGQSNLLNVDWVSYSWPSTPNGNPTATATAQLLSVVSFTGISNGVSDVVFGFNASSNTFQIAFAEDITDQATAVGTTAITVPEPGLAMAALTALGMVGLLHARRRAE